MLITGLRVHWWIFCFSYLTRLLQFSLIFFPLQILDMDLDPEDQDLFSNEEGIFQSSKNLYNDSLLVCLFTGMVCTCLAILLPPVYLYIVLNY